MAIGEIPPWVRGPNTLGATEAGASAGLGVAHIAAARESEAAREGMEAMRLRQASQLEQARLAQQAEQHQMEFQARTKLAEQNQLRAEQRLNIENAYKTAALGIQQGRLEEVEKIATEKAKNAVMQFQREQGFARDVAAGVPVMEAYQRNPVSASLLGSVGRTQLKEGAGGKPLLREGKFPLIEYDPKTGTTRTVYTPPKTEGVSAADKEDLKDLRHERDALSKKLSDTLTERIAPTPPAQKKAEQDRLNEINQQIEQIKRPGLKPPTTSTGTTGESKFGHPKVGEIRFGHRFKGGDPNEQSNWEPVKEGE